ncbi:DUF349 domain-containing protein [Corallincola platygyrae]|uniref:DUF349 domain-containing protein n=1 Tax=Corallincola platygyrae TaxID=1193278 RepID=A0ABW4XG37_9GAMM
MIFKNLFRPAWKHSDHEKRQAAISTLQLENQQHRTILRELAFNDGHRQVRRTALERLDDLSLWWLAAGEERDDGLKKSALQHVTDLITSSELKDASEVQSFVNDCKDKKFLESVWRQLSEAALRKSALSRIDKSRCYIDAAEHETDEALALWAAEQVDDEKQMRRLGKKAAQLSVRQYFEDKLKALKEAKEKPALLNEQARLNLAQLQGIIEKLLEPQAESHPELGQKANELLSRWSELSKELSQLELLQAWQQKFDSLNERLSVRLQELEALWSAQLAEQEKAIEQKENKALLDGGLDALAGDIKAIYTLIEEQQEYDLEPFNEVLTHLKQSIAEATLREDDWMALNKRSQQLEERLLQLAQLPEQISKASGIADQLVELSESADDFVSQFNTMRKAWQHLSELPLPKELKQRAESRLKALGKAKNEQLNAQKSAEADLDKQLWRAERHQRAGRLKVAVREFHRLQPIFNKLSDKARRRFDKRYQSLAKVEQELLEWHQLVAAPKATVLLEEIQQLAEKPLEDPKAQAEAVKDARKRWQTLELDRNDENWAPLADQFDELSEKAFETCRQFYGEQQKVREENLAARELLIKEMSDLLAKQQTEPMLLNQLESAYRQIANKWRRSGEIDFAKRKEVQSQYAKVSRQVSDILKKLYAENEARKQSLLKQAESLDLNELETASESFDDLMKQWRDAGYAGANEKALWQRFQAIGQQLREQKYASRNEQRAQWQAEADKYKAAMNSFSERVAAADTEVAIHDAIAKVQAETAEVGELANRERRQLETELDKLLTDAENKLVSFQKKAVKDNYQKLIEAISGDDQTLLEALPERWQRSLKTWQQEASDKTADSETRNRLMIEAELLAGLDSPGNNEALRQQLRLTLLQDRMNGGESRSVENLFWQWLEAGAVTADDKDALKRFEKALTA